MINLVTGDNREVVSSFRVYAYMCEKDYAGYKAWVESTVKAHDWVLIGIDDSHDGPDEHVEVSFGLKPRQGDLNFDDSELFAWLHELMATWSQFEPQMEL